MSELHPAKWWFAWRPVRTLDTEQTVWLKRVYREWWYEKNYFEHPHHQNKLKKAGDRKPWVSKAY